jgi:hypothetical protein
MFRNIKITNDGRAEDQVDSGLSCSTWKEFYWLLTPEGVSIFIDAKTFPEQLFVSIFYCQEGSSNFFWNFTTWPPNNTVSRSRQFRYRQKFKSHEDSQIPKKQT